MKLNSNTLKTVAATVKSNPRKFTSRSLVSTLAQKLGGVGIVRAALASLQSTKVVTFVRVASKGKQKGHFVLVPVKA